MVVGVDGSAGSDAALAWAVRYATARHRRLMAVYGAGDPTASPEWVAMVGAGPALDAGHRVARHAREVVERLAPDLELDVSTFLEDARTALLDQAADASMLVVGTRGFGPVRALLLGSVSTAVAAHAPCPVAVVRASEHETEPDPEDPAGLEGAVVVATDTGPTSFAALDVAFELASVEGRPLHVVHAWSVESELADLEQRAASMHEHERLLSESLAGYQERHPDVTVVRHLPRGDVVHTLVSMSQAARMVVVGSHRRTGVRMLLRSVSRELVERAHCTVVVAHA